MVNGRNEGVCITQVHSVPNITVHVCTDCRATHLLWLHLESRLDCAAHSTDRKAASGEQERSGNHGKQCSRWLSFIQWPPLNSNLFFPADSWLWIVQGFFRVLQICLRFGQTIEAGSTRNTRQSFVQWPPLNSNIFFCWFLISHCAVFSIVQIFCVLERREASKQHSQHTANFYTVVPA